MRPFARHPWVSTCFFRALCGALPGFLAVHPASAVGTAPHMTSLGISWGMSLYSPAFLENGYIPSKYTCDGENVSPPLHIRGVSAKARSLVLVMEDPDALGGDDRRAAISCIGRCGTWMRARASSARTAFRTVRWKATRISSCRPGRDPVRREGVHRYVFRLYALDVQLDLPPRADKSRLARSLRGHILDQCELVGLYGRDPARAATDSWIQRKFTN